MYLDFDWQRFDLNNEVHCMIKPMETWAMEKLANFFGAEVGDEQKAEEVQKRLEKINPIGNKKFIELVKDVLPVHAKDLRNLDIKLPGEERRAATIDDVVKFDGLLFAGTIILGQVIRISSLSLVDSDRLKKQ
jgi:hypothetical protein